MKGSSKFRFILFLAQSQVAMILKIIGAQKRRDPILNLFEVIPQILVLSTSIFF